MNRVCRICVLAWIGLGATCLLAQPPQRDPSGPPATAAAPGTITESKLGPIYLREKNGALVVYPGITLEEVERLQKLDREQQGVSPPKYLFTPGTTISGTADDTKADLEIRFQIQVQKRDEPVEEWISIPLRLNQGILVPPPTHTGEGEYLIEFNSKDGYVIWLRALSGTEHSFTAKFSVPLVKRNGARQLTLRAPDAPLKLRLNVSGSGTEATVNAGNLLNRPVRISADQTELVVDTVGGDVELSWRHLEELPPVLAAFGNISVTLEGRKLQYDTQLNVRSYGSPIDSFVVRLPGGAELLDTNRQPGLEYVLLPQVEKEIGRRLSVRRLEGKTSAPIEARFQCSLDVVESTPQQIAAFEVIDARHQKGTIDFTVEGEWSIDWQADTSVRRVDDLPDVLRQQKLAARFEYDRQPFSLLATISEKKTRITVEPTWLISVEANRITLDGTLKYRVSGARAKPLEIEMAGWKVDEVLPLELVSGDWQADETKLTIPLSPAVRDAGGEFELRLLATREHTASATMAAAATRFPADMIIGPALDIPSPLIGPKIAVLSHFREQSGEVTFALPRPTVDAGLPALVVISPADNVELTPIAGQLRSLINDTLPPEIKSVRQQQPLVYREDSAGPPAQFYGQFRVRSQSVTVAAETRLRVEELSSGVEQRFQYTIANEPLRGLRFLVPRTLADSGRFELLIDGVAASWTKQLTTQNADPTRIPINVDFRDPRIGACEVVFRHRHPHERPSIRTTKTVGTPLVQMQPDDKTTVTSHRLRVSRAANIAVELVDEDWTLIDDEPGANPDEQSYQSPDVPATVEFTASVDSAPAKRSTEVSRVWVQTLLTSSKRRDRACFRLTTNEQSVTFVLPAGATDEITVALNGQRTDRYSATPQGEVRVELGEASGPREITIELWYWFSVNAVPVGRLTLQAPQLLDAARSERAYWQLLLPQNEHLAWSSADLTSENSWQLEQFIWVRRAHRTQEELENWIKASNQGEFLDSGFNTYLFSSVGSLGQRNVYTITRPMAVLLIGGMVLAIGAALLYQPALRHPLFFLALGVVIIGFATAYPEPAMAAAQIITVGIALTLIGGFLMAFLSRPAPRRIVARQSAAQADSRTSKSASSRSVPAHLTTATLQPSLPVSASGNEP